MVDPDDTWSMIYTFKIECILCKYIKYIGFEGKYKNGPLLEIALKKSLLLGDFLHKDRNSFLP